jgi:phosphatidate cytidylyltransferase
VSAQHTTPSQGRAPGFRAIRFNMDWITRPLFGILLAGIALTVLLVGAAPLAAVIALGSIFAAREWHRCVGASPPYIAEAAVTAGTVALAEGALLYSHMFWPGITLAALGTIAAFVLALRQGKQPLWQAFGVLYLSLPALALVGLRDFPPHGALIVVGLFLIVWATDTGALICGNLIGGPRLAPKLSPGKTWAGTIGGSVTAALVFAAYIGFFFGAAAAMAAAPFAFLFSFSAHAGDLFESWVKRHFGLKDSGSAIPGHGGVLDRIDSTLAAAPVMAFLVLVLHFNPLFSGHA